MLFLPGKGKKKFPSAFAFLKCATKTKVLLTKTKVDAIIVADFIFEEDKGDVS